MSTAAITRDEFAASGPNVFELLFEERVAGLELVELLECERVDRTEQAQLTFQFANTAGRRRSVGQHGHRRRFGDRRLDVELATKRLDRGLEAQLRLGLAQLGLAGAFARCVECVLLLAARSAVLVEFGGQPADLVALATTLLDEVGVQHLDDVTVRRDPLDEPVDRADVTLDRDTSTFRSDARFGIGGETPFGLVETTFQQLLALVQPGVVDLEVLASRRQRCRSRFELGPQFAAGACRVGFCLLVGLQSGQQRFEFGDALLVANDVGGDVVDRPFEVLELGFGLAMLALRLRQPLRRCAEAGVVGIESTRQLGLGGASGLQRPLGRGNGLGGAFQSVRSGTRPFDRIVERGGRGATPGGADPPPAQAEPVAALGDDHGIRVAQRSIDRGAETVDSHGRSEQSVEQCVDAGT